MVQESMAGKGQKYERDMYYRKPANLDKEANWITVGPSLSGTSVRDFTMRGFIPLYEFGTIPHGETNRWKQILTHPDGPAAFPRDQVLELRWYKEPPVPGVKFPQLAGVKIREFRCPECSREPFTETEKLNAIRALGNHLRIIHGWDRMSLQRYGEAVGIDFNAVDAVQDIIVDVAVDESLTCEECGFTAKNAFGLQAHQRKHSEEPEIVTT